MKPRMKKLNLALIAASCGATLMVGLTTSPALAEDSGWYVGGNYGRSEAKINERKIRNNLQDIGFTTNHFSEDDRDRGYKLFGGYQFNRHLAIEGGYFDLGSFDFRAQTDPPGSLSGKIDIDGFNLDLVGILPLGNQISLIARIGANHAKSKGLFVGEGAVNVTDPRFSERDTNHKLGLGLQWALSKAVELRIEAERYRINDGVANRGDIDLFSLGLAVRFGTRSDATEAHAAPAALVLPVVVKAPVQTERYCNIVDMQFEIDTDDIQRQEEEKLLVLARFLKQYPETSVLIEGHTDDIGSHQYNLRLSQRRADSVMNHLVVDHNIALSRLTAIGYGETRPLADNRTEQGKRENRRIGAVVACVTDIAGLEPTPVRITMAMEIEFDQDGAEVGPQYHNGLRDVAEFLRANPSTVATVEGHADNSTPGDSAQISLQRAENVVSYLVENFSIEESRLTAEGFAEKRRLAYNTSEEGRQKNRRVNIILKYPR